MFEVGIPFKNRKDHRCSWFSGFWEIPPEVGISLRIIRTNKTPGNDLAVLNQDVKGKGIISFL